MPEPSARPQEGLFRRRLNALLRDKRPWKTRFVLALVCSFALFFTVAFFGPVEIMVYNVYSLAFCVQEMWLTVAGCALAETLLLALALSVFRGRVYDTLLCLLFSVTVACYIQGTFLGGEDVLTGDSIHWEQLLGDMVKNALFWMLVPLAVFLLHYFSKRLWRRVLWFGCALIVLMQSAALAAMGVQGLYHRTMNDFRSYLSREGVYSFSEQANVMVVIVDRMDLEYIQEILGRDSSFFDFLDGFTFYPNAMSEFIRTSPGANSILTGFDQNAYQVHRYSYYDSSWDWNGRHLLHDLADNGYTIDLYSQWNCLFGTGPEADTYVRNAVTADMALSRRGVLNGLMLLSGYRYAPLACKPFFWSDTERINRGAVLQEDLYYLDDIDFSNGLANVQAGQQQNSFRLLHLNGAHAPYTIDANGLRSMTETTAADQTMGCFRIFGELLDRMKALGIYEDAAIIITADHGSPETHHCPLTEPVTIGMFYKPAGSAGTPLATSDAPVANVNIPATVLKSIGADYSAYGPALDEITTETQPVRYLLFPYQDKSDCAEEILLTYEVREDARDFSNWRVTDSQPIAYPFWP